MAKTWTIKVNEDRVVEIIAKTFIYLKRAEDMGVHIDYQTLAERTFQRILDESEN